MKMRDVLILITTLALVCSVVLGQEAKDSLKAAKRANLKALRAWSQSLTESDYNASVWQSVHKQPQNAFDFYIQKLSDIYENEKAHVNFALVGACDGTNDKTIRDRFFPHQHWRGVMVEPFAINYQDLVRVMEAQQVLDRVTLLHGACTDKCPADQLKMKRPTFEEKNKSLPHWMRREIGAVVPADKMDRPATGGWVFEYTKCYTGSSVLKEWGDKVSASLGADNAMGKGRGGYKIRPHILKVDVEGHDYQVLMSFLNDDMPTFVLPLLISFEAKSISSHYEELRAHLVKRGYIVSHFANDGFALLHASVFRRGKAGGGSRGSSRQEEEAGDEGASSVDPGAKRRRRRGGGRSSKKDQMQDDAQA